VRIAQATYFVALIQSLLLRSHNMQMRRTLLALLGGLGLLLAGTSPAKATIDFNLVSGIGDTYVYTINFNPNGLEQMVAGTGLATLYDFAGLTAAAQITLDATASANFNPPTVQLLGINGFSQAPPDSPTINNATFTYKGPTISTTALLGTVTITGGLPAGSVLGIIGFYSGTSTDTSVTPSGSSGNTGRVQVPTLVSIPAPASIVMFGLGIGALSVVRLRKRFLPA